MDALGPHVAAVFCAAFFIAFAPPAPAQNRVDERDDFHNTTYVKSDDDKMKTFLFLAEEAEAEGDHPKAVANLARALRRGGDSLVPFGDRTFLTGRRAAARRLSLLPPGAFALYRETVALEAGRFLEAALAARDEGLLRETAERFPLTGEAFTALRTLGDLARERGEWLEAAESYQDYLDQASLFGPLRAAGAAAPGEGAPRPAAEGAGKEHRGSSSPPGEDPFVRERAAVRFALHLCLLCDGRFDEAAGFAPSKAPAGGPAAAAAEREARALGAKRKDAAAEGGWPTRGGGRSRSRLPSFDCKSLKLLWSYSLGREGKEPGDLPGGLSLRERRRLRAWRTASSVYPVVAGGRVYAFDQYRLHALDLETGKILFGPLSWDWSLLFGDEPPDLENVSYSGTVAGGVLYVVLNRRGPRGSFRAEHTGTILALDLDREGLCLWKRGGRVFSGGEKGSGGSDLPFEDMAFTGAPVVAGGRVFVMATRHGSAEDEAWILSFDAATGGLLFKRFLCSGVQIPRFGGRSDLVNPEMRDRIELGAPLVERAGRLYCLTNLGVAGALDAFTGEVLWLFKYNRIVAQDPDTYERAFFLDSGGWVDSLPLFRQGRFIFAPSDSRFLYTLAPQPDPRGYIVLDDPVEKGRYVSLIGTDGKLLYFTAREGGRNFIAAAERSGAMAWETELFAREDRITGRPLLTKTAVFVPTLRYIYRVDLAAQGLITHSFPAPLPPGGKWTDSQEPFFGNIITTQDRLISVSNTRILVYAPGGE